MKKKLLICLLAVLMCFTLVGCEDKKPNNDKKDDEYQGSTETGTGLDKVNNKNYKDTTNKIFGIYLEDNAGWTLTEVKSPNGVNNLNIFYDVNNGSDAKEIIKNLFYQTKAVSKDGIYSYAFNDSFTSMVKKDKYDDFDTFFAKEGTVIVDFYQAMWIYDNNGKSILFTVDIDETKAEISFTLMS